MDRIYIFFMFIPIMAFHGFLQAWVAHHLGDDTAKDEGRLTLNPISHIDYWGTLLVPAISLFFFQGTIGLVGWGKPIPVNPYNLANQRRDELLIALAGPFSNILLAFLGMLAGKFLIHWDPGSTELVNTFSLTAVFLAFFNILPFPWLDGWTIVRTLFNLPSELMEQSSLWWYLGMFLICQFTPLLNILFFFTQSIVIDMSRLLGI